jgi:hypothetical protein
MRAGPSLIRWVVGYEGRYLVQRDGTIYNGLAQPLAVRIDRYGYANVRLRADGRQSWKKVARLVAEAWHGPAPDAKAHAAHLDGNPLNNAAENIAWKSPKENNADKLLHGTHQAGERHPRAKLTPGQVEAIRSSKLSSRKLAAEYGVNQSQIVRIKNGSRWPEREETPDPGNGWGAANRGRASQRGQGLHRTHSKGGL